MSLPLQEKSRGEKISAGHPLSALPCRALTYSTFPLLSNLHSSLFRNARQEPSLLRSLTVPLQD